MGVRSLPTRDLKTRNENRGDSREVPVVQMTVQKFSGVHKNIKSLEVKVRE